MTYGEQAGPLSASSLRILRVCDSCCALKVASDFCSALAYI